MQTTLFVVGLSMVIGELNRMNKTRSLVLPVPMILAGFCLLTAGCSDDNQGPKIRKREGVAKSIDVENRKVSMSFTDKRGETHVLEGTFTDETVVFINGRSQGIKDIRPGDKVLVYGYTEGKGTDRRLIATRVRVSRPAETDWKPAGQGAATPTTQP
ncbi:MAG: hypothetical protein ACE5EQ_05080 [Phycisphaerae bacterium]